jgi:hypothetical protein
MGKNTFYRVLGSSLLLVVLFYLGILWFDPQVLDLRRLRYVAKSNQDTKILKPCHSKINANFFEDDWEMIFDYSICNTFERDLKETKVYYVLKFSPVGEDSLIGQGKKIFDSVKNISNPPFSKEIPLRVEGKIVCDSIFAKTFERNTLGEEIKGELMIPLTNRYVYEGNFTGSGKNCNGLIKFSRMNPKELRPQYKKLYQ